MINKIIFFIITSCVSVMLVACYGVRFNATMCDQIASDPMATVPNECRIYNEEDAKKAFDNTNKHKIDSNETVEFNKQ